MPDKEKIEEEELPDPFADFDPELFLQPPKVEIPLPEPEVEEEAKPVCPFYPKTCDWAGSWRCDSECKYNPESYMQPEIKKVFDETPWALYCFDCSEFVDSRPHEDVLNPPELLNSHTVTTGFTEYRQKLSEWTLKRITGK